MNVDEDYRGVLIKMTTPGGVSNDNINKAEKELGVVFPAVYRQFLAKYGAAMGTGFELAGLFVDSNKEESPVWKCVVLVTKQLRRASCGAIPNHFIPVSDDGQDTTFYIDTKSEAGRIVAYGPGIDGQTVATSFKEFVVKASGSEL